MPETEPKQTFVKIIDKPMHQITGTKFSTGSIVIEQETRLKKIITQVRWPDRNGDIKIEEASTLIYATEKTGELLSASEIVFYASPYFRILPNTSTDLYAEIHDANGNIVTDEAYTINFVILGDEDDLGYLLPDSDDTNKGIASVKFYSNENSDGSVSIQASADLDDDGSDDVFDTITITISTGAEGIILVPATDSSLAGTSVDIDLYIVDASFTYETEHIITGYDDPITLSATGPATLSVNTITAPDGTASFTLTSNGTAGTVEIIASAPDLDLGYTEVTFTGGAESIQLTPMNGSIYEGESIEISITILDENLNQTPFTGYISITSDSGGSFDPISPIEFDNQPFRTVDFSHNVATEGIEITATCDGLTLDSIYVDVLESLTPSYIGLTADPSSVEANGDEDDYSFITATIYDDSDPAEVVTNYTTPITFSISGGAGYFLDGETKVYTTIDITPSNGRAYINLYSDSSGTVTVTATSADLTEDSVDIVFYSSASYILLTNNSGSVVAGGEDYAVITATVCDADDNIVTNYLYDITFSVSDSGVGYLGDVNPVTPTDGIAQINLYSNEDGTATVTAESYDESQGKYLDLQPVAGINVEFTLPQDPEIQLLEDTVSAYSGKTIIQFEVEVTNADLQLATMEISWTDTAANLNKIEFASPTSEMDYEGIFTGNASYPGTTISDISKTLLMGNSIFKLTFDNNMNKEKIDIILTDINGIPYGQFEITI